ncbi:MAG: hypothetical protein ACLRSW_09130 [Christensenellaceae bacterium]
MMLCGNQAVNRLALLTPKDFSTGRETCSPALRDVLRGKQASDAIRLAAEFTTASIFRTAEAGRQSVRLCSNKKFSFSAKT